MREANFTDQNYGLDLTKEGDFVLGGTRFDHTTRYESDIFYVLDGKISHYLAVGDDMLDIERDWAFEWAEMFSSNSPAPTAKMTFLQTIKSTFGWA